MTASAPEVPHSPPMLEGMRITDLTTVIFGPYATQMLADLGAEVIKIEPDEGDTSRMIGTSQNTPTMMGPVYLRLNRGKRSVCWDLKSEAGRTALHRLIESSDVFIHNIRSSGIQRLGLDYEQVKAIRPDIIYVHCVGFDARGPYADLQAYDDVIQAAAGSASLLPVVDGNPEPRYVPMAMADKVSGLHAANAVLAAIVHRLRTGQGQKIEVPMFETVASFNLLEHLCDKTFLPPTGPSLYRRQVDPARQPMRTSDGWIALAPYLDDRWLRLLESLGCTDALQEARFIDKAARRANMSEMYRLVATYMPNRSTDEWLEIMKQINVPAMRVNTIDDLLSDPQLLAAGLLRTRTHPTEGDYIEVRPPVRFSAYAYPDACHAAQLGEHSREVAQELGVDPQAACGKPQGGS